MRVVKCIFWERDCIFGYARVRTLGTGKLVGRRAKLTKSTSFVLQAVLVSTGGVLPVCRRSSKTEKNKWITMSVFCRINVYWYTLLEERRSVARVCEAVRGVYRLGKAERVLDPFSWRNEMVHSAQCQTRGVFYHKSPPCSGW